MKEGKRVKGMGKGGEKMKKNTKKFNKKQYQKCFKKISGGP